MGRKAVRIAELIVPPSLVVLLAVVAALSSCPGSNVTNTAVTVGTKAATSAKTGTTEGTTTRTTGPASTTSTSSAVSTAETTRPTPPETVAADFPPELVDWTPWPEDPIFTAEGPGHWDVKIRERGWILREGGIWRLWFSGYDGADKDVKSVGYATSTDGIHWTRWPTNPIYSGHWVEDMTVVHQGDTYYMFAEGAHSNHAEMLTSKDGIDWKWIGELDVRKVGGKKAAPKPCGTPVVWVEGDTWYLMYEFYDKAEWLATTKDPMSLKWTNVQDDPVMRPGPAAYEKTMISVTQVIKYKGAYFAIYHGTGDAVPQTWTTNIARSTDLIHWQKYPGNPLVRWNKSSGIVVQMDNGFRLYTMHARVDLFVSE